MLNTSADMSRRASMKLGLGGMAAISMYCVFHSQVADAATGEAAKAAENDPVAQALGYVHDATKVDVAKFPKRLGAEGEKQFCHNCQFFAANAGVEWGPCQIFQGKLVSGKGWCNTWLIKSS